MPFGTYATPQSTFDNAVKLMQGAIRAYIKAVKDKFGEHGTVDLINVMGYYQLVSMLLNVDRYPLPAGVKPE